MERACGRYKATPNRKHTTRWSEETKEEIMNKGKWDKYLNIPRRLRQLQRTMKNF